MLLQTDIKPSLWDDPLSFQRPAQTKSSPRAPAEIIANQQKLVPYLAALREEAVAVIRAADKGYVDEKAQLLQYIIHFRLPDQPGWSQAFMQGINDYPVVLEAAPHAVSPLFDRLFPVRPIKEELESPDHITAKIILNRLRQASAEIAPRKTTDLLIKPARFAPEEEKPGKPPLGEFGRVVYPNLLKTMEHWIQNMAGPIWHLGFVVAPIPETPNIRHVKYSRTAGFTTPVH